MKFNELARCQRHKHPIVVLTVDLSVRHYCGERGVQYRPFVEMGEELFIV